jgi:NAD(P)-dependent dehydrogenase (short-subunit alcohol dehydrogenase family)
MRIVVIGATGRLGVALVQTFRDRGHEVLGAARRGPDLEVDLTRPETIAAMYERAGRVDAVAVAAGEAPWKPLAELTAEDLRAAAESKLLGQLEVVRAGVPHVAGSFTLITGVLARAFLRTASLASMVNGALETFVRAAAVELPQRINAVSPTVFAEALDDYGAFFPGFKAVPLAEVAAAFVRSVEGTETGRVLELGD